MLSVSVIIPTYNRAHLITRAIRSVLGEISDRDEIIVVDDGSTDNTAEALAPFRDTIRYIKISNSGAGAARNRGIREARSDLVAFLDSDDEWMPHKLELQRTVMQAFPNVLFAISDFAITDHAGNPERRFLRQWHRDPRSWEEMLGPGVSYSSIATLPDGCPDFKIHVGNLYLLCMLSSFVNTDTLLVRRQAAGDALRYAEDLPVYEDWECDARLAQKGQVAVLDTETAWQHGHAGPRLTDADLQLISATRIKLLERIWGADQNFLMKHGEIYYQTIMEQRLLRVKDLIYRGRLPEARQEMKSISNAPLILKALACMPQSVVHQVLYIRNLFRSK